MIDENTINEISELFMVLGTINLKSKFKPMLVSATLTKIAMKIVDTLEIDGKKYKLELTLMEI
jgi:hypothetical protein